MLKEIFTYIVLEEYEEELIIFGNCYFLKNFGPWKKGQVVKYIKVDYETGLIQELDPFDIDKIIKEVKIKIVEDK
jgi:hypothetical protein